MITSLKRIVGPALAIIFIAMFHATALASDSVGVITRLQQTASINGKAAQMGDHITRNDVIITNTTGRLEITFNDETTLTIGGDTEFRIESYTYDRDVSEPRAVLLLARGAFRIVTSAIIDAAPENFSVMTPLAAIGIRGTDFWGGYLSEESLDIVMLKGAGVTVTSMGGTVVIDEAGVGVSIPDPIKHPMGFAKALEKPELKKWGSDKLAQAIGTVAFQ